jgi:hypothetical protein
MGERRMKRVMVGAEERPEVQRASVRECCIARIARIEDGALHTGGSQRFIIEVGSLDEAPLLRMHGLPRLSARRRVWTIGARLGLDLMAHELDRDSSHLPRC